MKIAINEKQLQSILSNIEKEKDIKEDEPVSNSSSSMPSDSNIGSTTTTTQAAYPEVGKWESGVTRGAANQVGLTKWADIVGATLSRGKANPLKEQTLSSVPLKSNVHNELNPALDTPTKNYPTFYDTQIPLPTDGTVNFSLWSDNKPRYDVFGGVYTDKDGTLKWKSGLSKGRPAPDEAWMKDTFPSNTIKWIETLKDKRLYVPIITLRNHNTWTVSNGYYFSKGVEKVPFNPNKYIRKSIPTSIINFLKENWALVGEVLASLVAGILTGGASLWAQALWQAGIALGFAGASYIFDGGSELGFAMGVLIGFLPLIPAATKLGVKGPLLGLKKYGSQLATAKSEEEIYRIITNFPKDEQLIITRLIKQLPQKEIQHQLKGVIGKKLVEGFVKKVKNKTITPEWLQKIPASQLRWWKELLVEGGGVIPIVAGGFVYQSIQQRRQDEKEVMEMSLSSKFMLDALKSVSNKDSLSVDPEVRLQNLINDLDK